MEYQDLLHNASGDYKNKYVKFSGVVEHIENGEQNYVMIKTSNDPNNDQVIYIKGNKNNESLIVNDKVVIYGQVLGTIPITNSIGKQSKVPAIESYYVIINN